VPLEFVIWLRQASKSVKVELGQFRDVNHIALMPSDLLPETGSGETQGGLRAPVARIDTR